jgi:hypothetical protein
LINYKPVPGERIIFTDTSLDGRQHYGKVISWSPGRDTRAAQYNMPARDYFIGFDSPLWDNGPKQAWCAAEDLSPLSGNFTVTSNANITYNVSNTVPPEEWKDKLNNLTLTSTLQDKQEDKPWMAYYVTADEFFDVLRIAYDDTYGGGSDTPWHPEDMYTNVSCVLEVVTNTLSNMAKLRSGRQVKGIKES